MEGGGCLELELVKHAELGGLDYIGEAFWKRGGLSKGLRDEAVPRHDRDARTRSVYTCRRLCGGGLFPF